MSSKTENGMGTVPVPRLVLQTGLPLMLSLLIGSLYNVVDSIYVSYVSEDALTALSLASPVQVMMSALGCGIAVGLNAVVSKALGERNAAQVKNTVAASLFLAGCAWALITLAGLFLVKPYFAWQSGGNEAIARYGEEYLRICMLCSFGQMGQWVFDRLVIASGRSTLFLFTLSSASLTNILLDPIFIFGYLGLPAMGTAGAALATVIGQCVGCVAGFFINRRLNPETPISFTLRPDGKIVASILRVGIPTAVMQGVVSVMGVAVNSLLIGFSSTAVAVYGVCTKIQSLATVGVHGLNNGLIPIVAYNYGAGKGGRIHQAIRWTLIYGFAIGGLLLLVLEGAPTLVLHVFDASPEMMGLGVPALRILSLSYFISAAGMVLAAVFQALGQGLPSLFLTLCRQVLLPLVLIGAFFPFHNVMLVWWAFVLAEILAIPVGLLLWRRMKMTLLEQVPERPNVQVKAAPPHTP